MFMYLQKNKKGFTLIELMVVVAIIGILALLGLRLYTTQQNRAKESIVKANAGSVQVAIQTELVDTPASIDLSTLTDLGQLQNPFTGDKGYVATPGTGAVCAIVLSDVTLTAGDITGAIDKGATYEGFVGVYSDTSNSVYYIVGYGEDGDVIGGTTDPYALTARQ